MTLFDSLKLISLSLLVSVEINQFAYTSYSLKLPFFWVANPWLGVCADSTPFYHSSWNYQFPKRLIFEKAAPSTVIELKVTKCLFMFFMFIFYSTFHSRFSNCNHSIQREGGGAILIFSVTRKLGCNSLWFPSFSVLARHLYKRSIVTLPSSQNYTWGPNIIIIGECF